MHSLLISIILYTINCVFLILSSIEFGYSPFIIRYLHVDTSTILSINLIYSLYILLQNITGSIFLFVE